MARTRAETITLMITAVTRSESVVIPVIRIIGIASSIGVFLRGRSDSHTPHAKVPMTTIIITPVSVARRIISI